MRVQQRKNKPSKRKSIPHYLLENFESRTMLSAAAALAALPANWEANTPILFHPSSTGAISPAIGLRNPYGINTPTTILNAYGISSISFNGVQGDGTGQTIAIVDAYDLPTAATDLATFDNTYSIPAPPSFTKVNQRGLAGPLPGPDPTDHWEGEEALDIEWAHALAPGASIVVVETDNDGQGLYIGDEVAETLPNVSVVSNSWSGDEFAGETSLDSIFTTPAGHQGVTFAFATGDNGIYDADSNVVAPQYPATSPNVVAVGGTSLDNGFESAWGDGTSSGVDGGGGGGVSQYESQPQYQKFLDTLSTTNRTYPDISLEGDPEFGVAVADSYDNGGTTPWFAGPTGGTSLATPMFAALIAIANQGRVLAGNTTLDGATQVVPRLYTLPEADYNDITSGNDGNSAGVGYDLATGRGSPVANLLVHDLEANYVGFHVFQDGNGDGFQDSQEPGYAGETVQLLTPGLDGVVGTSDDLLVATTTTDAYGLYEFTGIATGSYYVHFAAVTGDNFSAVTNAGPATSNTVADPTTGNSPLFSVIPSTENSTENAGLFRETISITDVTITRPHSGLAPMQFVVTLSPNNLVATTVTYTTMDGTASAAAGDYIATSGTLNFAPGITSALITVDAVGNLTIENTVSFTVVCTVPTGIYNLKNVGVGTIINSNFPAAAVSTPAAQTRNAVTTTIFPFVVSLSAPAPFAVSVPYTTVDITAVGGADYIATSGTLIFPANSTAPQTVDVTVLPGTNRQLDKTFAFNVSASSTVVLGTPASTTATILTNAPPGLNANPVTVSESLSGITYLPFTVDVAPSLTGLVSVQYATSNGTAVAGTDYQAEAGTLYFSPGRIEQTVYVPVYQQFIAAQTKTVNFTLSNPTGNLVLTGSSVTGSIVYPGLVAVPFSGTKKASYVDSLNQLVTVTMKGPGSGEAVFLGSVSNATNAYEILVNNTTTASSVSMKVAGKGAQTSLTDVLINSPLGSFLAPTTNVVSLVTASGSLNTLTLGYAAGANITVGGAGSGQSLAVTFGRAVNTNITSAIAIKSLTAGAYLTTPGSTSRVTAPSIGTIKVTGGFQGTQVISSSITSVKVGGTIDGISLQANNSIGSVTAASILNSKFYAGVTDGAVSVPKSSAEFANPASQIGSVKVTGGVFSNTQIAGVTVGSVSSTAKLVTGSKVLVSSSALGKLRAATTFTHKLVQFSDPSRNILVGNVQVDLV